MSGFESVKPLLRAERMIFLASSIAAISVFVYSCLTPSMLVTREQYRGDQFFNQHQYNDAIDHYRQMLDASRKLGIYRNRSMESDVSRKIANGYEMTGRYEEAMTWVKQALSLDSIDNNIFNRIEDYRHEGNIHVYMGSFYKGIASLEKSLALCEGMDQSLKNTDRLSIADTYLSLAQLYAVMGRSRDALTYLDKALAIFRSAGEARGEMESYLALGTIYSDQGDVLNARKYTENSLKIAKEIKLGTARHYQLLATIESSLGEYENALRFQQMALEEAKKLGILAQIIWADIGMGDIYRDLGDLAHAEKFYKNAKEARDTSSVTAGSLEASIGLRLGDPSGANRYFSSQGSISGKAISSFRMADVMISKGNNDSAMILLNQAAHSFTSTGNLQGLTNVQVSLGRLFIDGKNTSRAAEVLDSALRITEFPETTWQAFYQKGRMYEMINQDDKAIEYYRNSVNVIEKIRGNLTIDEFKSSFFDSKRDVYDRLINLLEKNDNPAEAFRFSEQDRARSFYDILANRKIDFRGSMPGDLISKEQEKRIEMQKLFKLLQKSEAGTPSDDPAFRSEIKQLRDELAHDQSEYEDILEKIKLNNPSYAEMVKASPVRLSDLQKKLDPHTAALVYWISNSDLILWLVTDEGVLGNTLQVDNKTLSSLIEKTRKSIQSNFAEETSLGLSKLYSYLIEPVENRLAGISNLVIIPNGSLHFLPFQALKNRNGEYLVQKYNLIYAPSAGVYILCKERPAGKGSRFMGMALADISVGDKNGLPGTEDEVRKILPLFPDNISAFGVQSTETFVKKNAGRFNFIHFATHGSYNYRQPLYSCLLFPPSDEDDGRLNVYEVFEMNLDAKLVTLSACETGLGNINQGDEITGLSRAFLFAGSSSVLVSLWAVADYPTSVLMASFYRHLKDHPVQEALTLAQREVIKIFPQPLYWSPFILIGNGTVTAD